MTKPILAAPNSTPTDVDIVTVGTQLRGYDTYPFATGYLEEVVRAIAANHRQCRRRNCTICLHLRSGLALIIALHQVEQATIGGAQ